MHLHEGWIKRFVHWFGNQRKPLRGQARWAFTGLENLECRALLSIDPAAGSPISVGGLAPRSIATADLNGDGHADLVTANLSSNDISVLLGDGAGGFTTAPGSPFATGGTNPYSVAVADVNGDGKPDLVTTNAQSNDVSVLLGDGTGNFTPVPGSPFATGGTNPYSVAVADVNGDGKPDLLIANAASSNISVLLGDGTGGFAPATNSPISAGGTGPISVAAADVNGDGRIDVVTANSVSNNLSVLLGDGAGGFSAPLTIATGGTSPSCVVVADMDGDGRPDLVAANYSTNNISVLLGDGSGGFTPAPDSPFATVSIGGSRPRSVAVADVNGDGRPDLVTANYSSNNVSILLNDGAGGFTATASSPVATGGSGSIAVAVVDVNGDGVADFVTANLLSDNVSVLISGPFAYLSGSTLMLDFDGSASPIALATSGSFVTATQDTTTYEFPTASVSDIMGNGIASGDTLDCNADIARPLAFSGGLGNGTVNINSGTYSFNSDVGATTSLSVMINSGGNVVFNASQHLAALHVAGTGTAVVSANGTRVLCTPDLSIASTARLDLKDNALVVEGSNPSILGVWNGSAYTGITGLIASGRNGGTWSGDGIVTSMTDAGISIMRTTLSVATAAQVMGIGSSQTAVWRGETVSGGDTVIKYSYSGDANLSGVVDADDYFQIDAHYSTASDNAKSFFNGDFNYDGQINGDDYFIIDADFLAQGPRPSAPAALTITSVSDTAISFDWNNVDTNETSITVWRSMSGGAYTRLTSLPAGTNTFTDTTCSPNTTYRYALTADSAMASSPLSASIQQMTLPSAPINLSATAVSDTEINLTWDRIGTGENSITIWRSTGGGAYAKLVTLPAGSNIFTDTSCYPSTTYRYAVSADFATRSSPLSTFAEMTTLASQATVSTVAANFTAAAVSPFTINLSWTDNGSGSRDWFLERSSDGVSYSIIAVLSSVATSVSYTDMPLSPSTTYYYRTRLVTGSTVGDYCAPVSATTQSRVANTPIEPTSLVATVNSATSTTLTWNDTNNDAASYKIETSSFSWPSTPVWTQVGQTAVGATSYNLTTTAENFYYVRIRAANGSGNSGYTSQVAIRTASAGTGTGTPKTYKIGPGQTYTSLAALDWTTLGPGDTVQIYPNKDSNGNIIPYFEKPLISVRGTAAAPINIIGMADPATGQLPIIDGTNAVTAPQWDSHFLPLEDLSLILIGTRTSQSTTGYSPGYFNLQNLDIRNGYSGDPGTSLTYTASDGSIRPYSAGAVCGIYLEDGDHITIKGCTIHGNNEGVFGAGQGDQRNLENLTLDSNSIYGNGTINSSQTHNTYLEGIDTIYQFNKYGPLRTGSQGGGLKDRGAGTIIRYNWIQGGGHLIDLVEAQNYATVTLTLPSYSKTFVYGNIFDNADGAATTPIHYGGDTLPSPYYRKGVLYFYNNTVVNEDDVFRTNIFDLQTGADSLDARDNIIWSKGGTKPNQIELLSDPGTAYFGRNWITSDWVISRDFFPFTGAIAGTANLITNAQNDPGFVNTSTQNFGLTSFSQCLDQEDILAADELTPSYEYVDPVSGKARPVVGEALDLGAIEQGT